MDIPSISSLPNELLLKVFREALIFPFPYWDSKDWDHPWHKIPYIRIVTITHVCRRWRVVALHTPEFWTTVDVNRPMDCFDAFLERSKPHLLTVNAFSSRLRDPNPMDLERLFLKVPRYRSLNIGGPGTPFDDQMFNDMYPWDRCAQVIESIDHSGYNSRETYNHLPLLFQFELSALKSLTWSGWRLDNLMELSCPRLTKLVFRNDMVTLPWTRWLDFLRTTPLLRILELSEAVDPEPLHSMSSRSLPDSVVHLPHDSSILLEAI